ncbi:thioredoxin domain-containing protein [Pseudovibrio japonicus]|uniref:Thioredoxin domain-containing protein n=2 Tax=Pseudovibrio japonicus TaxID=366534 RepID=A0ABQ3E924_9HYPH|nr:thioredoxin domain-containing protein [Pseudovibrio japonicus]
MAHESFEDEATAALMNEHFVNIKVDREERPDIDQIYMQALHMLGQQGGWPLTMFLTPDGDPFWGGTYFPKEARHGSPAFKDILYAIAQSFTTDRDTIEENRQAISQALNKPPSEASPLSSFLITAAGKQLFTMQDEEEGGMKGAPKFPQASVQELIFRTAKAQKNTFMRDQFLKTTRAISQGGIYDHVGGGLARYAVDSIWLVPHFEKMLYDNAQFIEHLCWAYQETKDELFHVRIHEVIDWLERDMKLPEGGFASSMDADSEGIEGRFYVWTYDELKSLIPEEYFDLFSNTYEVTPDGNWEGKIILNRRHSPALLEPSEEAALASCRTILLDYRSKRIPPHKDDKVLADWNAMLICALVQASAVVSHESLRSSAKAAFAFITEYMFVDGKLSHSWRQGQRLEVGFASDYAWAARAALALYQSEPDPAEKQRYLKQAEEFLSILKERFTHSNGGFYMTDKDADDLILRPYHAYDEATPNYNAVAALAFSEHWILTGDTSSRDLADGTLNAFAADVPNNVFGTASLLTALDTRTRFKKALVVLGSGSEATPFLQTLHTQADPALYVDVIPEGAAKPVELENSTWNTNETTVFICSAKGCSLPATTLEQVKEQI